MANFLRPANTFSEPSKLLDSSVFPSLENLSPVISSEWPGAICMSGLLPHPGFIFHICRKETCVRKPNWKKQVRKQNNNSTGDFNFYVMPNSDFFGFVLMK